jgi:hypothetical protein
LEYVVSNDAAGSSGVIVDGLADGEGELTLQSEEGRRSHQRGSGHYIEKLTKGWRLTEGETSPKRTEVIALPLS